MARTLHCSVRGLSLHLISTVAAAIIARCSLLPVGAFNPSSQRQNTCPSFPPLLAVPVAITAESITQRIRSGLQASQNASRNITAAEEACDIWQGIFSLKDEEELTATLSMDVIKLSKSLYASCLVRTGQDAVAISIYQDLLELYASANTPQKLEWRLAKARCHQRLLEYAEGFDEYQSVLAESTIFPDENGQAVMGAVTCAMRLGNVAAADEILSSYIQATTTNAKPHQSQA
ncbi:MAG: hypothetical protein SGARI_005912, partial [Bacillariaceae sp.]